MLVLVPEVPLKLWKVVPPRLVLVPEVPLKLWKVVPPRLVLVPEVPSLKLWKVVPPRLVLVPEVPSLKLWKVVPPRTLPDKINNPQRTNILINLVLLAITIPPIKLMLQLVINQIDTHK